jgi:imidazoleglycerol-phosphate dehydratase
MMKKRSAKVKRTTRETDVAVEIGLDGRGDYKINTGLAFLDHMLELLSKHSLIDLKIAAKGDLKVDYHHTVEDIGLALGEALDKALGKRAGITRYGWGLVPMDEALSQVVVDLGGRPYLAMRMATKKKKILDFDLALLEEFFRAFSVQGRMNLHICQMYGNEPHHAYESAFKALAKALRMACSLDARQKGALPSTKGKI